MTRYDELLEKTGLERIPPYWDVRYTRNLEALSKPRFEVKAELDVEMTLRDGTRLRVDVYRPDGGGERFPALLSWSAYSKAMQALKRGTLPSRSLLFDHSLEAGDIDFFVRRGYAFVIPDPRGIGKSEGRFYGVYNPQEQQDTFDVIEWIAGLGWCSGDVGMVGYSYFGIIQMLAAAQQPPHLRCIMPLSFTDDYYQHGAYGGVQHTYLSMYWEMCPSHSPYSWSEKIYPTAELKRRIEERLQDPDIAVNSYFSKILNTWPPRYHTFFLDVLLHPLDGEFWRERSAAEMFERVKVPVYLKCGWAPNGRWTAPAFNAFMDERLAVPKRVGVMEGYGGLELPYRFMNEECLRWYDHWLKGIDTGLLDEPPLKLNIFGGGFRYETEWPLARTEWRKLYLRSFGKLRWEPDPETEVPPDCFTHLPPNITDEVPAITYTTDPFTRPMEFTGPVTLYLHAALDAADANFLVNLWVILPHGGRHPVSRFGALKASHRLIPERSKPWAPVHDHTRAVPVIPGEVYEYVIEINPMGWVIPAGHALQLEIKAMDPHPQQQTMWTGKTGNMGAIPSAQAIHYRLFRDHRYRSHLLMPLIASTPSEQWLRPLG